MKKAMRSLSPGPRASRFVPGLNAFSALCVSGVILAGGCRFSNSEPHGNNYDRNAMLASIGEHAIVATYGEYQTATVTLKAATAALRDAHLAAPPDPTAIATAQTAAQAAWRDAMAAWQRAETIGVGPAAPAEGEDGGVIGGRGLREVIYSWPIVNPCRVDQEVVSKDYESPGFMASETSNVLGLDALEYLLFVGPDANNACAPQNAINTPAAGGGPSPWSELTDVPQRRAAYAAALADGLASTATELYTTWAPSGSGGFLKQFSDAGRNGSQYSTVESAIEELLTGLFYIERFKDEKLGDPAALSKQGPCTNPCPDKLESRWAHASKAHILENLTGFQRVIYGGDPKQNHEGLDDFLRARGAGSVVDSYAAKHAAVITALAVLPGSLDEALTASPAAVSNLHAAVAELALTVGDIATALKIDLAIVPGGDGD